MNNSIHLPLFALGALFGCLPLQAQNVDEETILVKSKLVERVDSSLVVSMTFDLSNVELASDRSLVCTPLIERGDSLVALPSLIVNGRARHILYERTGRTPEKNREYELRRRNDTEQTFDYHARIPFRRWMERSEVSLVTDLCGCGWEALQNERSPLFAINMAQPVVLRPAVAYLTPEAEAVKARQLDGSAYLDFPVNRTEIHPDYRNNPAELAKIKQTIETVRGNKFATITGVTIKGYASPEGSYTNNARLAKGRAEALLDYVKGLYDFGNAEMRVESEPEDWAGLEKAIEAGNLPDKAELLAIIRADEPADLDAREWKLKTLNGGTSYKTLLRDVYPGLRHSDYTVDYTIRNFTVEEARELVFTDPSQLSLNELFLVARTFEAGSTQYNEVFETAVRLYPDDPVSNLNAAVTAIGAGQTDKARRYLEKAPSCPQKQLAEASLLMLEGKLDEAERILRPLADGSPVSAEAADNLKQIEVKRNE